MHEKTEMTLKSIEQILKSILKVEAYKKELKHEQVMKLAIVHVKVQQVLELEADIQKKREHKNGRY